VLQAFDIDEICPLRLYLIDISEAG